MAQEQDSGDPDERRAEEAREVAPFTQREARMSHGVHDTGDCQEPQGKQCERPARRQAPDAEAPDRELEEVERYEEAGGPLREAEELGEPTVEADRQLLGEVSRLEDDGDGSQPDSRPELHSTHLNAPARERQVESDGGGGPKTGRAEQDAPEPFAHLARPSQDGDPGQCTPKVPAE